MYAGYTGTSADGGISGCALPPATSPYSVSGNGEAHARLSCRIVDSNGHATTPSQVTTLEDWVFERCKDLISVSFQGPSQLKTIENRAFYSST